MKNMIGSFYQRNRRWYWRVKLPGCTAYQIFSLKPKGKALATKDREVAEECAKIILRRHATEFSTTKQGNIDIQKEIVIRQISQVLRSFSHAEAQSVLFAVLNHQDRQQHQ